KLARGGADVHFLMRRDLDAVREKGLQIRSPEGGFELTKVQAHGTTESMGTVDVVIVALKATDNQALLDLLLPLIREETMILTLQNGLGNEAWIARHFGSERMLGGLCFVCLNRTAPGLVEHFGEGTIMLGEYLRPPAARTRALAAEFQRCGIKVRLAEDLETARWHKLVWNVPFNGLAIVAGGVDVSVILGNESLALLARELMREVIGIAHQLGHRLPETFVEDQMKATGPMGPYKPSSLLDYLEGRPVEVEAIWGEAYRQGLSVNADVAHLETVYHLLKALCV
ncbi:MAG: 2-dehydropantoate 2-reductase, partial [Verrucomicrobiales bacterium]